MSADDLLARRARALGRRMCCSMASRCTSLDEPLHIVRAEGVWMFDAQGLRYLDAYNNVRPTRRD